jgi:hypothetical protein
VGNYFAAFTSNGGYTSDTKGDCNIHVDKIPEDTAINVRGRSWKILGEDIEIPTIPEGVYTASTDTVCENASQPYFKAMFVDRRLDYDLVAIAPFSEDKYDFIPNHGIDTSKCSGVTIQDIRLCGYFYNGIEMAYDDDYNIIASGASSPSGASLEYCYDIVSSTTENPCQGDYCISMRYNQYPKDASGKRIRRRFYEATVAGADIREAFWTSAFSATLDTKYEDVVRLNYDGIIPYVGWQQQPDSVGCVADTSPSKSGRTWAEHVNLGLINDDFGCPCEYRFSPDPTKKEIDKYSYPIKRYIDFKITLTDYLPISIVSCGYNLGLDGGPEDFSPITATLNGDERLNLNIRFGTSVIPTPVNSKTLPQTTKQEVDYGHFLYELGALSGEKIISCEEVGFLADFKDLGQTDMETYITCPKFIAIDQIKKFKIGDYGTSLKELEFAWQTLDKGDTDHIRFNKLSLRNWELDTKNESYKIKDVEGDKFILYENVTLSVEGGLTKVCNSICNIANKSNDADDEIYNLLHDYVWFMQVDNLTTPSHVFQPMTEGEDTSTFNQNYVALMYKKNVQTIANSNTIGTNLKRKLSSYEFSELYYFGNIKVEWKVVFSDGHYKKAKLEKFKAWNVEEGNKEMKGDVTINYKVIVQKFGYDATEFVLTSTIGETVDVDEEFYSYYDIMPPLIFSFSGHFAIYLTTENGIRYRFNYGLNQ